MRVVASLLGIALGIFAIHIVINIIIPLIGILWG